MRVALSVLFLLIGCTQADSANKAPTSACRQQLFEGARFTVCDPGKGELRLFAAAPGEKAIRSFADLQTTLDSSKVAFAMNAGMFDDDGRPIGLTTVDGTRKHKLNSRNGSGNFHLKPNGVFMILCGGSPAIFRSDAIPEFRCAPRLATQSGPMLVIAGKLHPKLQADGSSRYTRNGVGVRDGKSLFAISEEPVSLGKFARFFRDGLKAEEALYFDGSVSSLWDPANGRQDAHAPLGPIVVAFKPEASAPGPAAPAKP